MFQIAEWKGSDSVTRRIMAAGLASVSLLILASTATAAPSSFDQPKAVQTPTNPSTPLRGLDALKAQMNAMESGLENLRRLRTFFDTANFNETAILKRAERLIKTLPQDENAGDAAWRIAAVASLTLSSGTLADVDVDDAYRLTPGAMGWDLGPEGARVHTGFVPVSPANLKNADAAQATSGITALSDGIVALNKFEASLPNGLYRIVIVRDGADNEDPSDSPFGGAISVNGAPLVSQIGNDRDSVKMTGNDRKVATTGKSGSRPTALGLAIEGWAIVENGQLNVGFDGLPKGRAITAIIAEPFELDKLEISPAVMDTLAESLGDVATAAGPKANSARQGPRFGRVFGRAAASSSSAAAGTRPKSGTKTGSAPRRASTAPNRFASTRARVTPDSVSEQTSVVDTVKTLASTSDVPAFEERQLLVKRSIGDSPDTPGLAVDLGSLLDDASLNGVFICLTDPCEPSPALAPEPDLAAAAALLGDWLADPENLAPDWIDLETVLAGRSAGSEVAMVYEFEIGTDSWTNVELRASAGSGLFVWLDGTYIFGASEAGAFVDDLNFEYILELPDLSGGTHFLQVLSESHIADQGFAFELRGTPVSATTSVSEPGTLALFGFTLLGLGALRRRAA